MTTFLASLPILILIIVMGGFKLSGDKSSIITLAATLIISLFAFHTPFADISYSFLFGMLKALVPILFIIVMAIYSYNVLLLTGKIEILKRQFASISSDKSIQVLLITWGFGGLLEGMAGFGTAVAIPAAILISLGFKPGFSAIVSLLANSVATGFGAVGVPVIVLGTETGLEPNALSPIVVKQLAPLMILIPLALAFLSDPKLKSLPKNIALGISVGAVSLAAQYYSARYIGVETPAIIGSLAAIVLIILMGKIFSKKDKAEDKRVYPVRSIANAWAVYAFIMLLIILTSPLFPGMRNFLNSIAVSVIRFPINGEIKNYSINWLTQGGLLLFIGSFLGGWIQGASPKDLIRTLWKTLKQLRKTIVTVICLVGFSSVMETAGMINALAVALAEATGTLYPLFSPAIGALGTFLTGSDTSANILFGKLQAGVSTQIGIDPHWLAAANTAGATGGKIISPQSIAIATSACDRQGEEGLILKNALPYSLAYVAITGIVVYLFA